MNIESIHLNERIIVSFDVDSSEQAGIWLKNAIGRAMGVADLVFSRAKRALKLGCDGGVSSGLEAERMRAELGEKLLIVLHLASGREQISAI